jgi:hypothetical protein
VRSVADTQRLCSRRLEGADSCKKRAVACKKFIGEPIAIDFSTADGDGTQFA